MSLRTDRPYRPDDYSYGSQPSQKKTDDKSEKTKKVVKKIPDPKSASPQKERNLSNLSPLRKRSMSQETSLVNYSSDEEEENESASSRENKIFKEVHKSKTSSLSIITPPSGLFNYGAKTPDPSPLPDIALQTNPWDKVEPDKKELNSSTVEEPPNPNEVFRAFNKKEKKIKHMSEGSYHTVFSFVNDTTKVLKTINEKSNLPKSSSLMDNINYRYKILKQELESYQKLIDNKIGVAEIHNIKTASKDGYLIIEKINNKTDISPWQASVGKKPRFEELNRIDPKLQPQLEQVRKLITEMFRQNNLIAPDFKPENVCFDKDNKLVIIDFCEDWGMRECRGGIEKLMTIAAEKWAGNNNYIKAYLLKGIEDIKADREAEKLRQTKKK